MISGLAAPALTIFCIQQQTCSSIVPGSPTELSQVLGANIGVKVTYDGKVPAINTEEGSYNMMVAENFDNKLIFIGKIKCLSIFGLIE